MSTAAQRFSAAWLLFDGGSGVILSAPICKSLPHPSLLFVCSGTQHASAAAFLVLSSFFLSIALRSFNKKELHGKAFQNRARQGKTRSSATGHGRCQHDVYGRSRARPQRP